MSHETPDYGMPVPDREFLLNEELLTFSQGVLRATEALKNPHAR